ncbi:MAG: SH3 domain-containing protein [Blastocatellia bacterium]|nr:SH3 domain-containing protein [Blastocatellia bacterium]
MRFKSWLKPVGLFFTCTCLSSLCLIPVDIFPGVVPQPGSQAEGRPQAARQRMKLLPVDEGNRNGSFRQFRRELLHALHKRDKAFLRQHLSPLIMNGFGGSGGLQEFQETWHWEKPDSPLWEELATTLRLGGRFSNGTQTEFNAPYVATEWEQVQKSLPDGPERFAALVAAQVPVYQTPARQAPVISSLSYEVVEVVEDPDSTGPLPAPEWQKIKLAPGQFGFVEGKFLRDPTGYRATFRKVGTIWKMTVFLAGD